MEKIANDDAPLADSEIEVKERLAYDPRDSLYARLDIDQALEALSKKQREVFELVIMEGLTEREAALRLGISRNSVKTYMRRIKKTLKKYF